MNKGRRGSHHRIADTVIHLLVAISYLYQMPYRRLEGFTRTLHEVVSITMTTDNAYDSAAPRLLDGAERRLRVAEASMDGAYDSGPVYEELESGGVGAVIKPRRNAWSDTGPSARSVAVVQVM